MRVRFFSAYFASLFAFGLFVFFWDFRALGLASREGEGSVEVGIFDVCMVSPWLRVSVLLSSF